MDPPGNPTHRSVPSPRSPPPLALSEFLAQTTPCSVSPPPSIEAALNPDPSDAREVEESLRDAGKDEPRAQTPQHRPQETQTPSSNPQDAPPIDWQATRLQLLPRRNQGNKADWVRGWSEAVSEHGEETYCACSETLDSHRGRKGKTSEIAGSVRAILQGNGGNSSSNSKPTTASEPEICRHCSRPSSPPPSTTTTPGSLATSEGKMGSQQGRGRGFSKRVSELLMRVRPRQSRSAHNNKREAEMRNLTWGGGAGIEDCQPKWATGNGPGQKRFLGRPPSQPVSKSQSMDIFPSHHARGKRATTRSSQLSGTSDSDGPRVGGGNGLSRSMSRLQRAAALLGRTARPKSRGPG